MSEGKGYVVRGFLDGAAVYAVKREWVYEGGDPPERYATIDAAAAALECMVATGCADVRIFAVAPDGTETPLPTYEEALEQLDSVRRVIPEEHARYSSPHLSIAAILGEQDAAEAKLAMLRDAAETALRAHAARGMGGAPSELEGCPVGALRAILGMIGGAR